MSLMFPPTPTIGQEFIGDGFLYIFDGVKWTSLPLASGTEDPLGGYSELVATSITSVDASVYNVASEEIDGNVTISFINIPVGAYTCTTWIDFVSGNFTYPVNTTWLKGGVEPTMVAGINFIMWTTLDGVNWTASHSSVGV